MTDITEHRRISPVSGTIPLTFLEALPHALFAVDDDATIMYANMSAQVITGVTREDLFGKSLWYCAPQLVSLPLYQAVQKSKQSRVPTDIEYLSPTTLRWLHASLSPTDKGLVIFFRELLEPPLCQDGLNQGEQMYRNLLESCADGVTILTPDGLVLDINQRSLTDAHLKREKVIGKPFIDLPAWSYDPVVQQQLRTAIAQASQGETVRFETRIRPRTDLYLDILMTITSQCDINQQIEHLICTSCIITERKQTTDEKCYSLVDTIPHFVWFAESDGFTFYCNQRLLDYLAMSLEQTKGDGWMAAVHPDDRQHVREVWYTSIKKGVPYEAEYRLQDGTSGTYRWFLVRGMPQRNAQGEIQSWVGTHTDIDKQKCAEARVKASEQNFRMLTEMVPQLVWTLQSDGQLGYVNQRYRDWIQPDFELSGDDLWRQFVHPDDIERTLMLRHHALETGEPYENEYRLRNSQTGEYHWFLARGMPVRDEAGHVIKWFGTSTNIEEQKRIEEALRRSQERANALMNSPIIGIHINEGDQIVEANDTFLRMTGYTCEDLHAGKINWVQMTPPEHRRLQQSHQELVDHQYVAPYEKEYIRKDGSRLPVVVGRVALATNPSQGISFVLDNSVRKELERRKDDFINMASHELRNPIAVLKMQLTLLRRQLTRQGPKDMIPAFSRMETQLNIVSRLVEELLDVSKMQAGKLEYHQECVNLNDLLQEVTDTLQSLHTSHTILVHDAVQISMMVDRNRLGQVLVNLISNAIRYSPGAETVEVDLDRSGDMVSISVHDHGFGIPREQCEKIFERFYRVSDHRRSVPGLGIGLYIVAEIVKQYGGTINVESEIGKGSTFTVTLPLKPCII